MRKRWSNVTAQHVLDAIKQFDEIQERHSPSKTTFLLYNNREYPAKHIRGLAYKIANKMEISTDDYNGGEETAKFLNKLGFVVWYNGEIYKP